MTQNLSREAALSLGVSKVRLMKSGFSEIWKKLSAWCLKIVTKCFFGFFYQQTLQHVMQMETL